MRLIDADELREFLVRAGRFLKIQDDKRTAAHAVGKIIEHIDNMPTIDAEPVRHGHWKIFIPSVIGDRRKFYNCSVCNYEVQGKKPNYCPNCGAKMDE